MATPVGEKPRLSRPGSAKTADRSDVLLQKLSKKFRHAMETREQLLNGGGARSVKFNPETIDVSIGGTATPGHIKMDVTSASDVTASLSTSGLSTDGSCSMDGSSSSEQEPSVIEVRVPSTGSASDPRAQGLMGRVGGATPVVPVLPSRPTGKFSSSSAVPSSVRALLATESPAARRIGGGGRFMSSVGSETPLSDRVAALTARATPECFRSVAFETPAGPRGVKHRRSSIADLDSSDEQDGSSVTVAVRVRPFSDKEQLRPGVRCVVSMMENETSVTSDSGMVSRFNYDYSFWSFDRIGGSFADQQHVYNTLAQPMLGRAFEGYNVCLFAYGQTGSGKSYSIMGTQQEPGVIPRFCEELFGRVEDQKEDNLSINVEISFFEIYNEKIHDLLALANTSKIAPGKRINLKVREDPVLGPFVEGLSKYVVRSFEDVKGWLSVGNKHRATAATGMNEKSSRSHSVFTMVLTQTRTEDIEGEEHKHSITSKINLVDLAGSERQSHAKTTGDRLREGASINKSLHTLGKVISLLAEQSREHNKKKKIFIPYRDSVLTWLLKESLGGNSKTAMLATIGPSDKHIEETLSTLRYANQARSIINIARVNEDANARLIRELRAEIEMLRTHTGSDDHAVGVIVALQEKLNAKEHEMEEMTRSWQERLKQSEERKLQEAQLLEKSGISFQVDNTQPSLVNLNEDPQLSETLLYILREGQTRIGRQLTGASHDIQLMGPLIAENHCVITNTSHVVTLCPLAEGQTYVNGTLVAKETQLHHGDRVILGGDHYFRFSHPVEAQRSRKSDCGSTASKGVLKDFEYAKQELIRVQDER